MSVEAISADSPSIHQANDVTTHWATPRDSLVGGTAIAGQSI
jgi:hypothetical protein